MSGQRRSPEGTRDRCEGTELEERCCEGRGAEAIKARC